MRFPVLARAHREDLLVLAPAAPPPLRQRPPKAQTRQKPLDRAAFLHPNMTAILSLQLRAYAPNLRAIVLFAANQERKFFKYSGNARRGIHNLRSETPAECWNAPRCE